VSTPPGAFSAPPQAEAAPPPGRRWLRNLLIGCGILALLLAAAFIGLVLYLRQKPEALTDLMMKQIETHYAADGKAEEKDALRAAYADFRKALQERRVSRDSLERVRKTLVSGGGATDMTAEQVRELTREFREGAAGKSSLSPGSAPLGSTPPAPTPSP